MVVASCFQVMAGVWADVAVQEIQDEENNIPYTGEVGAGVLVFAIIKASPPCS